MHKACVAFALFPLLLSVSPSLSAQNAAQPRERIIVTLQPVRVLTSSRDDAEPDVSPDGRRVAFSRRIGDSLSAGGQQLWTVPFNGGSGQRLTPADFPYNATCPSWSPDGQVIAFRASRRVEGTDGGGIWLMSASGTEIRPVITDSGVDDYYPQWFPDGRRMVILRDVPGKDSDVWMVDLDSPTAAQLTSHPALDGKSTVSPDGRDIAFPSERSGQRNIWIMPLAKGEAGVRQLTTNGGRGPAWSPDGRWIGYGCPVAPERYALCLKAVAGGPVIQVTDGKANDFNPEWAPDGKVIVVSQISGLAVIDVTTIVK